jgi:arginyl-tRNA synthetase
MTANEQTEYFKVLIKALGEIDKNLADKTAHLPFGFVDLKEGKMSSRSGNIVSAFWLLDETKKRIREGFKEVSEAVLEDLSTGSVKWSMLRFSRESNIKFSIEESIDLAGNSGPYMQYTYARISSILDKSGKANFEAKAVKTFTPELLALGRIVCQFDSNIKTAADNFSPNILTDYLFTLAQNFNAFYEKEKIIGSPEEEEKLIVCLAVKNVIGQGLKLLGINTPEKI